MWALPNINKMNEEAALRYETEKDLSKKQILKGQTCMYCDKKATRYYDYYDIFSDDPKGKIFLCAKHDGYYGNPAEGYFFCEGCERTMVENYTWELYSHDTNEGRLCLNCYFDSEIKKQENWIDKVEQVADRVWESKHLIPVEGTHWKKYLDFHGNVELDSMSGAKITGFSSTSTVESGIAELQEIVKKTLGIGPVILIMDAAYQFAMSIGVYTRKKEEHETRFLGADIKTRDM